VPHVVPIFIKNNQVVTRGPEASLISVGLTSHSAQNLFRISEWNELGRPKRVKPGTIGFNIDTKSIEIWNGESWLVLQMKKLQ